MSYLSITKTFVLASLNNNNNNNPKIKTIKKNNKHLQLPQENKPKQPSISQIERAIGAGTSRDTDPKELEQITSAVNGLVTNFTGEIEGDVQRKIRETGESISNQTERTFRSNGKRILLFFFQWVLPIWILSLLVAAKIIKLPFSTPLLDDLIL